MEPYVTILTYSAAAGVLTSSYLIVRYGRPVRGGVSSPAPKQVVKLVKTFSLTLVGVVSLYAFVILVLVMFRIRLPEPQYSILTSVMTGMVFAGVGFVAGTMLAVISRRAIIYVVRKFVALRYVRRDVSEDVRRVRNFVYEVAVTLRRRTRQRP